MKNIKEIYDRAHIENWSSNNLNAELERQHNTGVEIIKHLSNVLTTPHAKDDVKSWAMNKINSFMGED